MKNVFHLHKLRFSHPILGSSGRAQSEADVMENIGVVLEVSIILHGSIQVYQQKTVTIHQSCLQLTVNEYNEQRENNKQVSHAQKPRPNLE